MFAFRVSLPGNCPWTRRFRPACFPVSRSRSNAVMVRGGVARSRGPVGCETAEITAPSPNSRAKTLLGIPPPPPGLGVCMAVGLFYLGPGASSGGGFPPCPRKWAGLLQVSGPPKEVRVARFTSPPEFSPETALLL